MVKVAAAKDDVVSFAAIDNVLVSHTTHATANARHLLRHSGCDRDKDISG